MCKVPKSKYYKNKYFIRNKLHDNNFLENFYSIVVKFALPEKSSRYAYQLISQDSGWPFLGNLRSSHQLTFNLFYFKDQEKTPIKFLQFLKGTYFSFNDIMLRHCIYIFILVFIYRPLCDYKIYVLRHNIWLNNLIRIFFITKLRLTKILTFCKQNSLLDLQ